MALINCPECDKEISDISKSCVQCGYKLSSSKALERKMIIICSIALLAVIAIVIAIGKISFGSSKRASDIIFYEGVRLLNEIDKLGDDWMNMTYYLNQFEKKMANIPKEESDEVFINGVLVTVDRLSSSCLFEYLFDNNEGMKDLSEDVVNGMRQKIIEYKEEYQEGSKLLRNNDISGLKRFIVKLEKEDAKKRK